MVGLLLNPSGPPSNTVVVPRVIVSVCGLDCRRSCKQAQALHLGREERVNDEDDGLRTGVKVKLLEKKQQEKKRV